MNKRRSSTINSKVKLPHYKITNKDLKNLEKMIFKYISPADFYISIGKTENIFGMPKARYEFNSAKQVSEHIIRKRPLSINSKAPNITIKFDRCSTTVYSGRIFRDGDEREKLGNLYSEIVKYLNQ